MLLLRRRRLLFYLLPCGISVCLDGLAVRVGDSSVCCPRSCQSCSETECHHSECCPSFILKQRRPCLAANETACFFARDDNDLAKAAAARQLALTVDFCKRGVADFHRYAVCCPLECGHCDEKSRFMKCRPSSARNNGPCERAHQTSCATKIYDEVSVKKNSKVDVVIAGDRVQALGVLASARSVFLSTPDSSRLRVHAIVDTESVSTIEKAFRCLTARDTWRTHDFFFKLYGFDLSKHLMQQKEEKKSPFMKQPMIRAPANEHKGNLAAGANFARFYLCDILPTIDKIVYLDADTVVLGDVSLLFDSYLNDTKAAIAAVSRRYKPMCGSFINCKSPEVRLLLRSQGIFDPERELDAFNAGVMVMHLNNWRQSKLTEKVEFWIGWNADLPVYKLGSNPPLVLAVRENFEHLDTFWNCQRGHLCWDQDAKARHWSGHHKPWTLNFQRDTIEWLPFLKGTLSDNNVARCLGPRIPRPGVKMQLQVSDESSQRKFDGREQRLVTASTLESSEELLKIAETLISKNFSSIEEALELQKQRNMGDLVLERAITSMEAWPSCKAETLAKDLTNMMRSLEDCDFFLVAILNKKELHVDVSRHGRGMPCGLAPAATASATLNYLVTFLDLGLFEAEEDLFFVISPNGPASAVSRPVFAHFKLHSAQKAILVPGPNHVTLKYDDKKQSRQQRGRNNQDGEIFIDNDANEERSSDQPMIFGASVSREVKLWAASRFEALRSASGVNESFLNATLWRQRHARVGWRGRVDADFSCGDSGSWARLAAAALTLAHPGLFDARLTRPLMLTDVAARKCLARASTSPSHARFLRRIIVKRDIGTARQTSHLLQQLLKYRLLLAIPENQGCHDATFPSLFGLGAAILKWQTPCVDYLDAALEPGHTHLDVDLESSLAIVAALLENDIATQYLAIRAKTLYDQVLCPKCAGQFWARLLRHYHSRFIGQGIIDIKALLAKHGAILVRHTETSPAWMPADFLTKQR